MNKSFNNEIISNTIVYLFENKVIRAPQFGFFKVDRGLPDAFYEACKNKGMVKNDKESIKKLGKHCFYAGLVTYFGQSQMQAPIEEQSDVQIEATIGMYNSVDMIKQGEMFVQQLGWGPFDTAAKKNSMINSLIDIAASIYISHNTTGFLKKTINIDGIDNYAYLAFCLGVTVGIYGNLVKASDFYR